MKKTWSRKSRDIVPLTGGMLFRYEGPEGRYVEDPGTPDECGREAIEDINFLEAEQNYIGRKLLSKYINGWWDLKTDGVMIYFKKCVWDTITTGKGHPKKLNLDKKKHFLFDCK